MSADEIVEKFWGHTTQGAKLCTWDDLIDLASAVIADEREACAKIAEEKSMIQEYRWKNGNYYSDAAHQAAEAIRARGKMA